MTVVPFAPQRRDDPVGGDRCIDGSAGLSASRTKEPFDLHGEHLYLDQDRQGKWQLVLGSPRAAEQRWATPLAGECQLITRVGDLIVVATTAAGQRALGLDAETGAVRWKFGF